MKWRFSVWILHEHILLLTCIFTCISIPTTIWWLRITWKSCEGIGNSSARNTLENPGYFLQNRFSVLFCLSKWNSWNKGRFLCGTATGRCPWWSSYSKDHTHCQPAQGPKPGEGNDIASKGQKLETWLQGNTQRSHLWEIWALHDITHFRLHLNMN